MKLKEKFQRLWVEFKEAVVPGFLLWLFLHLIVAVVAVIMVGSANGWNAQVWPDVMTITIMSFLMSSVAAVTLALVPVHMNRLGSFLIVYLVMGCTAGIVIAGLIALGGVFHDGVLWPKIATQYPAWCGAVAVFAGLYAANSPDSKWM